MRALLVSDFGIHHTPGGAQRSNQIIIDKGISRGHTVDVMHYDTIGDFNLLFYDAVISSNLEVISKSNIIDILSKINNHYRLEHDMNSYLTREDRIKLWSGCRKSFFLTKFHYEKFIESYGNIFKNVVIVPDPIDSSFRNMGFERIDKTIYIGFMHPLKGTNLFIKYAEENPDKEFVAACWGSKEYTDKILSLPNVQYLGVVDYKEMPTLYNSYASMYYTPVVNEPFCRGVGEALMCGMRNFITNDRIGSLLMYNENPSRFAESCINAADTFWEVIENDNNNS